MELLYIWVEEYKNIKEQGFNFSPKYRFEFTYNANDSSKNELTVEKRENVIENFFGEGVSNVTAIVGENGAGKTTLLEILSQLSSPKQLSLKGRTTDSLKVIPFKIIIILLNEENFLINHNFKLEPNIKFDFTKIESDDFKRLSFIFHANTYTNQTTMNIGRGTIDISTEKLAGANFLPAKQRFMNLRVNNVLNQAKFIANQEQIIDKSILRKPNKYILKTNSIRPILNDKPYIIKIEKIEAERLNYVTYICVKTNAIK